MLKGKSKSRKEELSLKSGRKELYNFRSCVQVGLTKTISKQKTEVVREYLGQRK